jgi:chromosome segregation ATPase
MRPKAAIIILVVITVGLGIALIVLTQKYSAHRVQADNQINKLSNDVVSTQGRLDEQRAVNLTLESNLATSKVEDSNKLAAFEANLATVQTDLTQSRDAAKAAAETAAAEVAQRDKKISDLENQNQQLDKKSLDLRGAITTLETQIAVTQKKLADSEGDRDLLLRELKRLKAEKADLERKFNDLAMLREQIRKLRNELAISQRLELLRREIYATFTDNGPEHPLHPAPPAPPTNANLEVELRQHAGATIVTPTNAFPK